MPLMTEIFDRRIPDSILLQLDTLVLDLGSIPADRLEKDLLRERRVSVDRHGQMSATVIEPLRVGTGATLLSAELKTGRTHQIRVQLAHLGHPILGDEKYGDFLLNNSAAKQGLKRMFLHAAELQLEHPTRGEPLLFKAALPPDLERVAAILLGQKRESCQWLKTNG